MPYIISMGHTKVMFGNSPHLPLNLHRSHVISCGLLGSHILTTAERGHL